MEKRYYIRKYIDATRHKHTIIKLKLLGSKGARDYPMTKICVNDKSYFHDKVVEEQIIEFTVNELQTENILSIEMTDKSPKDTEVKNSKIVSDKKLQICEIKIDDVNIRTYIFTGKQKPRYHYNNQGPEEVISEHLFFQGKWELYYENPARQFFANLVGSKQAINSSSKQAVKNKYLTKLQNLWTQHL